MDALRPPPVSRDVSAAALMRALADGQQGTLGVLSGPLGYRSAEDLRPLTIEQRQEMVSAERVALWAPFAGGLLGSIVGLVGLAFGVGATGRLTLPPAAVLLASMLGGTVVEMFVGSLIGQAETPETPV